MLNVDKIKQLLKEKKITQREFYNDLNLPNNSLTKWSKQKSIPNVIIAYNIAAYLNVRIEFIIDMPFLE